MSFGGSPKRAAYRKGLWGERLAALFLQLKGYRILARRYRTPVGELDVIAQKGTVIVAVEVKTRATLREAQDILAMCSHQRMYRALSFYLTHHGRYATYDIRLDGICLGAWFFPVHMRGLSR